MMNHKTQLSAMETTQFSSQCDQLTWTLLLLLLLLLLIIFRSMTNAPMDMWILYGMERQFGFSYNATLFTLTKLLQKRNEKSVVSRQ